MLNLGPVIDCPAEVLDIRFFGHHSPLLYGLLYHGERARAQLMFAPSARSGQYRRSPPLSSAFDLHGIGPSWIAESIFAGADHGLADDAAGWTLIAQSRGVMPHAFTFRSCDSREAIAHLFWSFGWRGRDGRCQRQSVFQFGKSVPDCTAY